MNPSDIGEALHGLRRIIDWHRRTISAVLLGVAALATLSALSPRHPAGREVWTAARDLHGGAPLRAGDLVLRPLPLPLVPSGALVAGSHVIGRLLAAPVRRGEPLTDVRLLEPSLLAALARPGQVAVPVRVADGGAAAALARPGDLVDVLATTSGEDGSASAPVAVATAATVLSVPARDAADGSDAGLVIVAVDPSQAAALAAATARSRLSIVLRRP